MAPVSPKTAKKRLKTSTGKFRRLFEEMAEGFALVEPVFDKQEVPTSYRYLEVNPAFERMVQKTRADLLGRTIHEVFPAVSQHAIAVMGRVARSGMPERFEDFSPAMNMWVAYYAYSPEPGKAAYLVADITERRRAEQELERSNQKNREILASIREDFYVLDRKWIFVYANRQFTSRIGKEPEEFIGNCIWTMFPKHLGTQYEANLRAAMEKREVRRFEMSGKYTNAVYSMAIFPSEEGITVLGTDITAQKQAEEATRALALFPEENPFPVLRIDREGALLFANRASSDILAHFRAQVGQGAPKLFSQAVRKALESKTVHTFDFTHGIAVYSFAAVPITDRGYVNLYGRDVTEQRRAEASLMRLTEELEARVEERTLQLQAANRELQAFSYSVSHDLKAPLRIIEGFAALLAHGDQGNLTEKQREQIEAIRKGASQMGELVKAVLDFSLLAQRPLRTVRVDSKRLVEEILAEQRQFLGEAEASRVSVSMAELPEVEADPLLLRQVFANLLSNAFKFTRTVANPTISVGAERSTNEVTFRVADNGVGFPRDRAQRLFNIFQRLHPQREFEGNGVGLANVRRIIERHGGTVYCEGEEGKGATFSFTIPHVPDRTGREEEKEPDTEAP